VLLQSLSRVNLHFIHKYICCKQFWFSRMKSFIKITKFHVCLVKILQQKMCVYFPLICRGMEKLEIAVLKKRTSTASPLRIRTDNSCSKLDLYSIRRGQKNHKVIVSVSDRTKIQSAEDAWCDPTEYATPCLIKHRMAIKRWCVNHAGLTLLCVIYDYDL
jgi:hypothetical protein